MPSRCIGRGEKDKGANELHKTLLLFIITLIFLLSTLPLVAQEPSLILPEEFTAFDTPNDAGKSISLVWKVSSSDCEGVEYIISGSTNPDGPWQEIVRLDATKWFKSDAPQYFGLGTKHKEYHFYEVTNIPGRAETLTNGTPYYFQLAMTNGAITAPSPTTISARSRGNWFDSSKTNILIFVIIFSALIMFFIAAARRNPHLFIRRIPGLDAVEEAIGRATEMGKPILYLTGLYDMSYVPTIAATCILGRVARKVANYDSQIKVPSYDPIVMTVCQEIVREAYLEAGRPDAFKEDNIFFVTTDQFAYVAAVDGIMLRERPAANFYMGYYFAESLLLAETGASVGAIQIAGTDSVTQLPFFIVTCDYTLMGEELYAASAYLSREPLQLGSLKGQDVSKAFILIVLLIGAILSTSGIYFILNLFKTF